MELLDTKTGVILGYRGWHVHNGTLISLSSRAVWPFKERLEATHSIHDERELVDHGNDPPCKGTLHCGIYALKSPVSVSVDNSAVWGEVKLWGKVVEHRLGYRAQYAYPSWLVTTDPFEAQLLEMFYGVPVFIKEIPMENEKKESVVINAGKNPSPAGADSLANVIFRSGISGEQFTYNGAADAETIARWFEGILPNFIAQNAVTYGGIQHYFQIQVFPRQRR